ncbi:S-layer homology domain-containing protein [Mesobacillus subterraneus]|uniref:immunoglobulin-like domain-containing protein n=1 Tax=Mesobacillus subterraneus TaxID=285983 RepID=UPI00203DEC70|nr:immunoglobulin-like domain-containing protein [Mesobacillus subterraneus]MCM3574419.1 S-layer homology domain-containing protein [Mesobacillus subterraneus]
MNKSYKRFLAASVAGTVVASVAAPIAPVNVLSVDAASGFSDVYKENYFYEAVVNLTQRGVIKGFGDGTYKPNQEVTRAQAAAIIAASLGLNTKTPKNPGFNDVKPGTWYYGAVAALVEKKIMSGIDSDTFLPNKPVTRAEMAKMLSNAYNLKATSTKTTFKDVPEKSWFASFVSSLVESKVTSGISPSAFAPGQAVTRGQMAAFVYRAEKATAVKIEKVSASNVTIGGKTYDLAESVKSILNPANEDALKNALVRFEETKGSITKITYLEITANGTSAGDLVLNGNNTVIDGNVKINGDYVSVKNLTVKGQFELGAGVQKSFYSSHLTVAGKTIIGSAATVKTSSFDTAFYKGLTQKVSISSLQAAAEEKSSKITFDNANLKSVDVNKNDVLVESTGASKIEEINLTANVSVKATDGVVIPKITVSAGAEAVEINAKVSELAVNSTKPLTLSGNATIDNVKIQQSSAVSLNTTGEIKQIQSENKDTKLTIGKTTQVGNIVVPEGTDVSKVVTNYDEVKENIEQVGGETNPDAVQPAPPPSTDPAPPPVNEEDVKAVAEAKSALVEASLLNGNESIDAVTGDLTLPVTGTDDTTITWNSSNPNIVGVDGKVVRPAYTEDDATVILTATISKNGVSDSKTFEVVVKKKEQTDAEAVAAAKAGLVEAVILNGNQGLNAVTGNLVLPGAGLDGTAIAWSTSNPDVVAADGTVTRPPYTEEDVTVTLTATISKNDVSESKTFTVIVKKMVQTDGEAVAAAKDGLVEATLLNGNESLGAVTGDLTLPVNGMDGTAISWASSNTSVVANDGTVTRPAYTEADAQVTLTATISKNGISDTKTFEVVVKKKEQTDAEAVAADKAGLVDSTILYNNESLENVTGELALPLEGINGTTISWTSSNPEVVTEDGVVTRPAHDEADVEVTLTATISKNTASDTKTFTVIVKKEEQPAGPVVEPIELYNGLGTLTSIYELFPTNDEYFQLTITKVESSDPDVLIAGVEEYGQISLTPIANGSATLTITFSNGKVAEVPFEVSSLDMTLAGLNALEIDPAKSNEYKYKAARKIIEGLIDTSSNLDYARANDNIKGSMIEWVLKKKPEGGFASVEELTSSFEMVVATVVELETEYSKYVFEMDVFSNLELDENGQEIALDVTSRLIRVPRTELNSTINRTINILPYQGQELYIEEQDGKVMHVKNNETDETIQHSFFFELEKNGINRTGRITAKIAPQSAIIAAPVISYHSDSFNVSYTGETIMVEVQSQYQLDEITAVQDGHIVPVTYYAGGNFGSPATYKVFLNEVKGPDQELKITAKVGDKVGEHTITLKDQAVPFIYEVEKDVVNNKFIVTFSEPVLLIEGTDLKDIFKVAKGEVTDAQQVNDTTFEVTVTDIDTDYLEIPKNDLGGIIEANDSWVYSNHDFFIFNNTPEVMATIMNKLSADRDPLRVSVSLPRQGIHIVEGDKFSYETVERTDIQWSHSIDSLLDINATSTEALEKMDKAMRESNEYEDLEYIGLEGYEAADVLSLMYEDGIERVTGSRNIYTFAKYRTTSGDIAYSQKYFSAVIAIDKDIALSIVGTLFSNIPADLTNYEADDLNRYKEQFAEQIELLQKLGVTEAEIQQLANYDKYEALIG